MCTNLFQRIQGIMSRLDRMTELNKFYPLELETRVLDIYFRYDDRTDDDFLFISVIYISKVKILLEKLKILKT